VATGIPLNRATLDVKFCDPGAKDERVVFNSLSFFAFFIAVLAIYQVPLPWWLRKAFLLVASSAFYAAWQPSMLALLWVSILTDWWVAQWMARTEDAVKRRLLLSISLVVNLGVLGFFKYGNFFQSNVVQFAGVLGYHIHADPVAIGLPIGISFYTFETLSYTIDVYRRSEKPWKKFLDFSLFLTFFPHLVAGPILRPSAFLPQCTTEQKTRLSELAWGLMVVVFGLFQKMVLADYLLAPVTDRVFSYPAELAWADAWIGALAFSAQIFFDFAGYSLCAIGFALCFGFKLPDNFDCPYGAIGFSDFWKRWHISLSSWLRDYLYVSLGGNRAGNVATYRNLMVTMLLGGLWHGASWNYVIWGGLHGIYLIVERLLRRHNTFSVGHVGPWAGHLGVLATYAAVVVAWVFFRAADLAVAWRVLCAMAGATSAPRMAFGSRWDPLLVLLTNIGLLVCHVVFRNIPLSRIADAVPSWLLSICLGFMLFMLLVANGGGHVFIYFQF
jgi:alginate O-acetyltransferase complex protein AlgI